MSGCRIDGYGTAWCVGFATAEFDVTVRSDGVVSVE